MSGFRLLYFGSIPLITCHDVSTEDGMPPSSPSNVFNVLAVIAIAAKTAAAEFGTVYDATVAQQSARTYRRAYEAYERLIEITEDQLVRVWQSQGKE